ncbi:hypothetical protein [Chishuiella sp.]|uniref:hypothetical protein n=1 Tax=Chishuiella sp. TaxID=1969467 RepID=UPI0028AAA22B|nr:hypothetical protein [Chishuiella sp.]
MKKLVLNAIVLTIFGTLFSVSACKQEKPKTETDSTIVEDSLKIEKEEAPTIGSDSVESVTVDSTKTKEETK